MPRDLPVVWGLLDDRPGHATQVQGIGDALPWPMIEKPLTFGWLSRLDNRILGASALGLSRVARAGLVPPWPDLLVTCGRRCLPVARWIKRQAGGRTRIVHVMRPSISTDIDLLVLPYHDRQLTNEEVEVIRVTGAPHRVNAARLAEGAQTFLPRFAHLPEPRIAVLVGGPAHHVRYRRDWARELGLRAVALAESLGGSLMVTTSRRTGSHAAAELAMTLKIPHVIWKPGDPEPNPYLGMLALADAVVVSVDSVSMVSEACATGKPVHVYGGDRLVGHKLKMLVTRLFKEGRIVALGDPFDHAPPPPLDAAGEVAAVIMDRAEQWFTQTTRVNAALSEAG
ncbi:MAG TPA: mitochondrial fission ELM1 family protein [Geminicoccus sp.]|uniref:mitochondrial fission ELM1 family protein n=1 Tax=Geminicoccus sp. TaxID=2024832 RepID=UPI002E3720C0|nr:mitochondrial fission ELM1 family protein [Geminicoccus sp.]HEX2526572.1 mitochondrial fission ELM1 family protein [Geminicoccus sp.]